MTREVTERDFRRSEFYDADPKDYEFRDDGKIVRKDRWETGIRRIASALEFNVRGGFEIDDVVQKVKDLHQNPTVVNQDLIRSLSWALSHLEGFNGFRGDDEDEYASAKEVLEQARQDIE